MLSTILEFDQYQKFDKTPFIIYAVLECSIEKSERRKDTSENFFTTNAGDHNASAFSMHTISSLKSIKNKHEVHRGKNCLRKSWESLRNGDY